MSNAYLTLLHTENTNLYTMLAFLSAKGLNQKTTSRAPLNHLSLHFNNEKTLLSVKCLYTNIDILVRTMHFKHIYWEHITVTVKYDFKYKPRTFFYLLIKLELQQRQRCLITCLFRSACDLCQLISTVAVCIKILHIMESLVLEEFWCKK